MALASVMLSLEDAEPKFIIDVILDPSCMAVHPHMEENMQKLEELIPPAEIPMGREVMSNIDELEPLSDEQRE